MKRILLSGVLIGLFIGIGTIAAILYATGYRFDFGGNSGKFLEGTGLLVATSKPDGARVLINGHLTTATNNTINLQPGEYTVEIQKDGYVSWKKKITIKNSLVSEANALLLPSAPKLEAITTIGIQSIVMDSTNGLLAYTVASSSALKNGVYLLDMKSRPFIFLGTSGTQIVNDVVDKFSSAELTFSPDGEQILAKLPSAFYLLNRNGGNNNPQDVTNTLNAVQRDFEQQKLEIDKKLSESFSKELRTVSSQNFKNMLPSPEGDKIFYEASRSGSLPFVLKKKVPSTNSTPDQRGLKSGNFYVYDIKEDKNYLIADNSDANEEPDKYFWHADSRHLIYANSGKINISEYDGGNLTTIYEGPFSDNLIFPWPDGSSIAVVAKLSSNVPFNLYRIGLQ